jgi:hypothetical protein
VRRGPEQREEGHRKRTDREGARAAGDRERRGGRGAAARGRGATGVGCMNASKVGSSPEPPGAPDHGSKDAKRSRHSEATDDMDASYEGAASGLAGKGKEREEPGSDEEDSDDDMSDAGKDDARGGIKQLPPPPGQSGPACWWPRGRARCRGPPAPGFVWA